MNEKKILLLLHLETGELREFSGYWSWKEVYQQIKGFEKSGKWKIKSINVELNN